MIVEMANIHPEDGIEKCQQLKLKLWLVVLYVYEASFMVYDVKGFRIMVGNRWMCDVIIWYQINHVSNEIWIAEHPWEEGERGWETAHLAYVP